jgi:hypothetical protein
LQVAGQLGELAPGRAAALAKACVEAHERGHVDRHRHQHDERELPVEQEDRDQHGDHRDRVHERLHVAVGDHVEHRVDVAHEPQHQLAGARLAEPAHRERL